MPDESPLLDGLERTIADAEESRDPERAYCRAKLVPACEGWTQQAMVDETWTYRDGTYLCDPCLGRIEPFMPVDAVRRDYDDTVKRLREKDSGEHRETA